VATYLERDVIQQSPLASLTDYRRTLRAATLTMGQLVNVASMARDVSVTASTVRRYLELMEATHMLGRLPAYAINRTKRLIKSPKIYLGDGGLAAFLAGDHDADTAWRSPLAGAYLEQAVLQELLVEASLMTPSAAVYYWRTSDNYEVDFVVEWGRKLIGIEVKRTSRPLHADARGLRVFIEEYRDRATCGVLLHTGEEVRALGERIVALPLSVFWNRLT
jgi:predicted AAA+ superfamily ATPase